MSAQYYIRAVHEKFDYLANWLPNSPLAVGDVGWWTPGGFRKDTTLRALGLGHRPRRSKMPGALEHDSVEEVKALAGAEAGGATLRLGFAKGGGFVFRAAGCTVEAIDDFDALSVEMLDLFHDRIWKKDWVVVDSIVHVERARIIVSEGADAGLDLAGPADLSGMLDAQVEVVAQRGSVTKFLGDAGLVPLFRARRVTRRWWRLLPPEVAPVMRSIDGELPPPELEHVGPDDAAPAPEG